LELGSEKDIIAKEQHKNKTVKQQTVSVIYTESQIKGSLELTPFTFL